MAYDSSTGHVVLFGGVGGSIWGDTWTLQAATANLGTANVCPVGTTTPSTCSQVTTLAFDVAASTTLGSINILTQGATGLDFNATPSDASTTLCVRQTYSSETVCTADVTFTPTKPGMRKGAVVIKDGSSNVLATTYIYGTGVGPQVAFSPGTLSSIGTNFGSYGVAVGSSGNV
jgi:hypothetical protein